MNHGTIFNSRCDQIKRKTKVQPIFTVSSVNDGVKDDMICISVSSLQLFQDLFSVQQSL